MAKQVQDAYIVAATRTPVGKAPRGMFRNVRPDDMLAHVLKAALAQMPRPRPGGGRRRDRRLRDAGSRAGHERRAHRAAARGAARHRLGHDHQPLLLLGRAGGGAGGGPHPAGRSRRDDRGRHREHEHGADGRQQDVVQRARSSSKDENVAIAYGMGITAEKVAQQWKVSREEQDLFAAESHRRALARDRERRVQGRDRRRTRSTSSCPTSPRARSGTRTRDGGDRRRSARATPRPRCWRSCGRRSPRRAASPPATARRCRTAPAAVVLMSEAALKRFNLQPLGRFRRATRWRACRRTSWASARSRRFPRCSSRRGSSRTTSTGSS